MNYIHLDSSVLTRQNYEITKNFPTEWITSYALKKYNLERGLIFNQSSFLFILWITLHWFFSPEVKPKRKNLCPHKDRPPPPCPGSHSLSSTATHWRKLSIDWKNIQKIIFLPSLKLLNETNIFYFSANFSESYQLRNIWKHPQSLNCVREYFHLASEQCFPVGCR